MMYMYVYEAVRGCLLTTNILGKDSKSVTIVVVSLTGRHQASYYHFQALFSDSMVLMSNYKWCFMITILSDPIIFVFLR